MSDAAPTPQKTLTLFDYDFYMTGEKIVTLTVDVGKGATLVEKDYGWVYHNGSGGYVTIFRPHVQYIAHRERTLRVADEYVPEEQRAAGERPAKKVPRKVGGLLVH